MNTAAFWSYILLTAITPGPNNLMAMTHSTRFGLRKSLAFCSGVLCGFVVNMSLCALFTAALHQYIPEIMPFTKWIGAGYILYLALSIFRHKPHVSTAKKKLKISSLFTTAVLLQFVNMKGILYGLTAFHSYILPQSQAVGMLTLGVLILSFTAFASTCCWAVFGSLFQRFFEKYKMPMNIIMALLLMYCAVMAVL